MARPKLTEEELKLKQEKIETKTQVSTATGYVRGADYYGGKK